MSKDDYPEYKIIFENDEEAYNFAKGLYCFKYSRSSWMIEEFKDIFEMVIAQINTQYDIRQEAKELKESGTKIKPVKRKAEQEQWLIYE